MNQSESINQIFIYLMWQWKEKVPTPWCSIFPHVMAPGESQMDPVQTEGTVSLLRSPEQKVPIFLCIHGLGRGRGERLEVERYWGKIEKSNLAKNLKKEASAEVPKKCLR